MHGDIVATADDDSAAVGISSYFESTEYGMPRDTNTTAPTRYAWLGAQQRSDDDLGGLTLMGVRLYNPQTGRFLSVDSIPGGNANAYAYPCNPINDFDLDGKRKESRWNKLKRLAKEALACASLGSSWACGVAIKMSLMALHAVKGMTDSEGNAVRHFMWQSALTFFFGTGAAKRLGDAHEYGLSKTNQAADSRRDQRNNVISRRWASHHMSSMFNASFYLLGPLMRYLFKKGKQLYDNFTLQHFAY